MRVPCLRSSPVRRSASNAPKRNKCGEVAGDPITHWPESSTGAAVKEPAGALPRARSCSESIAYTVIYVPFAGEAASIERQAAIGESGARKRTAPTQKRAKRASRAQKKGELYEKSPGPRRPRNRLRRHHRRRPKPYAG